MIRGTNAGTFRRAALAAATLLLCLPAAGGFGQRPVSRPQSARQSAPHYSAPRSQPSRPQNPRQQMGRPQNYGRPAQQYPQYRGTPGANQAPVNPSMATRPGYPGSAYPGSSYPGSSYPGSAYTAPGYSSPNYPRYMQPGYAPPGHLG